MSYTTGDLGTAFVTEMLAVVSDLPLTQIDTAVDELLRCRNNGGKVVAVGNGGSASTAAHFASDLSKFATWPATGFRALDLCSNFSSTTAWTNDEGWENAYVHQVAAWIDPGDVFVAFSVNGGSGFSSNLVSAMSKASDLGATTIGIAGNGGGQFAELADVPITIPTPSASSQITPITEAVHVVIHHLIAAAIRHELVDG